MGRLGIDFGGTKVGVGLTEGQRTVTRRHDFSRGMTAGDVLDFAAAKARILDCDGVESVAVVTPGAVVDGTVSYAPNVPGWEGLDLASWAAGQWPGAHVQVANDVNAAAFAEASYGELVGCQMGLYVNLGTGIAAAIVSEGTIQMGPRGLAGEIGYALPGSVESLDWDCDDAPLELLIGGAGLAAWAEQLGCRADGAAVLEHLIGTDREKLLVERLDELARVLSTCVLLVDPQRVVLGGGLSRSAYVVDHIRRRLAARRVTDVDVRVSAFGADASLTGAIALANKAMEDGSRE